MGSSDGSAETTRVGSCDEEGSGDGAKDSAPLGPSVGSTEGRDVEGIVDGTPDGSSLGTIVGTNEGPFDDAVGAGEAVGITQESPKHWTLAAQLHV